MVRGEHLNNEGTKTEQAWVPLKSFLDDRVESSEVESSEVESSEVESSEVESSHASRANGASRASRLEMLWSRGWVNELILLLEYP